MNAMPPDAQAVLDFWFGPDDVTRVEWFRKDPAFDARIRERFGPLVERALHGELDDWQAEPRSALARIVLLDQFTRNMFRDQARAFEGDPQALAAARSMVASGQDRALSALQRGFVYLPFQHAEDLAAQEESVRLCAALAAESPHQGAESIDYAHRHRVIIERFGRFPHRNAALGRPSTPEEVAFLRQPGSRF